MRQDVWLHMHCLVVDPDRLGRKHLRSFIFPAERVEGRDGVSVDPDVDFSAAFDITRKKSMEDQGKMPFDHGKLLVDDLVAFVAGLILKKAIQITPDDDRAGVSHSLDER